MAKTIKRSKGRRLGGGAYTSLRTLGAIAAANAAGALGKAGGQFIGNKVQQRLNFKRGGGAVRTRGKARKRAFAKLTTHSDMHLVKFHIKGPKSKTKVDKNSRVHYTDTYAVNESGNTGLQTVFQARYTHHLNQLTGALNTTENDRSTWATSIYFLNPNRLTSGSAALPATAAPAAEALFCSGSKSSLTLTNFEPIAAHIEIFWVLCRKDSTFEPTASWENANVSLGMGQALFGQPVNAAGVPSAGYTNIQLYGQDPTENPYFKKFWRVLHHKEFILQGGDTARFEYTRTINKLIRKPDLANATQMQQGLTFVPMIVVKPAPVDMFVTTDLIGSARVNTGTCKVGVMQTDTMTYYNIPTKTLPVNRAFSSNINSTFALTTQNFIDDEDDVAPVTQA